jgi:hypothetical protein
MENVGIVYVYGMWGAAVAQRFSGENEKIN